MQIFEIILYIIGTIGIVGASIPYFQEQTWYLRAWTYPRIQLVIVNTVILIAFLIVIGLQDWWEWAFASGLLFTAIFCLADIIPFTGLWPKQVPDVPEEACEFTVSMVLGNVLMDNDNREELLNSIYTRDPDIVLIVETNRKWQTYLSELEDRYPYTYLLPLEDFNGMMFYSKFKIKDVQERYLVQDHIPSLTIDLDIKGQTVRFYGIHPRPPRPEDDTADLDKELEIVAREVADCPHPAIISGDLNDVGWSNETKNFLKISSTIDPRRGRGLFNTFNAKRWYVRWPLDHLFHTPHFGLVDMKRLPKFGSDHFPMYIKLGFRA